MILSKRVLLIMVILLVSRMIFASDILTLFGEANVYLTEKNYEKAKPLFEEVSNLCLEEKSLAYYLYARCYVAFCDYGMADYSSMHRTSYDALDFFEKWEKKDSFPIPTINYLIGLSYFELGNTAKALQYLKTAYKQNLKYNSLLWIVEDLYNNLAICYLDFADYEKVRLYSKQALQSKNEQINVGDFAQWNNLIAKSYQYENKFDEAGVYYKKAIQNIEKIKKLKRKDYALIILNDYAGYLILTGNISEANKIIEEIERLGPNKANYVNYKQNQAKLALNQNLEVKALSLFNEAIDFTKEYAGEHHFDVIESYYDIAEAFEQKNRSNEVLRFLELSLAANTYPDELNSSSAKYIIPKFALKALFLKAKTTAKINYEQSKSVSKEVIDLLEHMIEIDINIFESKLYMVQYVRSYFKELIDIALLNGDIESAFYLCQQSHGLVLDLQVDENALKSNMLDPITLARDQNFKKEVSKLRTDLFELNQGSDSILLQSTRKQLFNLQYQYDRFSDSLSANFPNLNQDLSHTNNSIEEIQSHLKDESGLMLEYFITDKEIYIFKIEADSISAHKDSIPDNFTEMVANFMNQTTTVSNNRFEEFVNTSHELYTIIIEPILDKPYEGNDKLYIIPDGILNYIPFDALIHSKPVNPGVNRYDLLSYLVESFEINYNYSSLLYQFNKKPIVQNLSGFAPAFEDSENRNDGLTPLLYNIDELLIIDDIIDGEMYVDSTARLNKFLESVNTFNIAHLATHAVCNDSLPMKSIIYFHEEELNTYEIYNMPNSLDLVVLSACNTGYGQLKKGEGIMSLARAFMASGCGSIITSLWNVNDRVSLKLMPEFYKEIANSQHIGSALRSAKLNYLNNSESILDAHPYYWSGYVLVGDDIKFNKQYLSLPFYVLIIFLILGILFFLFKKY